MKMFWLHVLADAVSILTCQLGLINNQMLKYIGMGRNKIGYYEIARGDAAMTSQTEREFRPRTWTVKA